MVDIIACEAPTLFTMLTLLTMCDIMVVSITIERNVMVYEEIPDLAKYLPEDIETVEMVSKTVPPTECKIRK